MLETKSRASGRRPAAGLRKGSPQTVEMAGDGPAPALGHPRRAEAEGARLGLRALRLELGEGSRAVVVGCRTGRRGRLVAQTLRQKRGEKSRGSTQALACARMGENLAARRIQNTRLLLWSPPREQHGHTGSEAHFSTCLSTPDFLPRTIILQAVGEAGGNGSGREQTCGKGAWLYMRSRNRHGGGPVLSCGTANCNEARHRHSQPRRR
jgi:hypothetical protein